MAFLGNSILYYNDCPRFLVNLGEGSSGAGEGQGRVAHQDSCLRGGTNLSQLWERGNGMARHGFATDAARIGGDSGGASFDLGSPTVEDLLGGCREKWDFVVVNDHTQGPARPGSRKATQEILLEKYLPLVLENRATLVVVETAAYRFPGIINSEDLGSTREFQGLVREGVQSYVRALEGKLPRSIRPRVAPVGSAYLNVRDRNEKLWEGLFDPHDHFHPSPSGTFLQGCVLHCTMFGTPPPLPRTEADIARLWRDARAMHHPKTGGNRPLPSVDDAEYLWDVARNICG